MYAWDHGTCLAIASSAARLARDTGALEVLAITTNVLAQATALAGDFPQTERLIAEASQPTLEEVLDRAGGRSGGSVSLADAVKTVQGDRARR